jgi:hypothetical protein
MRGLKRPGVCLGIALATLQPWPARARATETRLRTTLEREGERKALRRALTGALRRLERPRCQQIFRDFKDSTGQTLQQGLDAVGQNGASFLQDWVFFADGRQERRCADTRVLAVTQPGSRSVWICGLRFSREQWRDPEHAEVVLIHETLHVLGLGEDPPSSEAISRQVLARCGSPAPQPNGN